MLPRSLRGMSCISWRPRSSPSQEMTPVISSSGPRTPDTFNWGTGLGMLCQLRWRLISIWHLLVTEGHGCPSETASARWLLVLPASAHLLPLGRAGYLDAPRRCCQCSHSFRQLGKRSSKARVCTGRSSLDVRLLWFCKRWGFTKKPTPKLRKLQIISAATETALNVNRGNVA